MPDHTPDDLTTLKRAELDKAAKKAGVADPEALPNKDAVIEAIEGPNPALEPEPPAPPREREYEVVGPVAVHGHKPGSKFTALIQPPQEAHLIEAGHIKRTSEED